MEQKGIKMEMNREEFIKELSKNVRWKDPITGLEIINNNGNSEGDSEEKQFNQDRIIENIFITIFLLAFGFLGVMFYLSIR